MKHFIRGAALAVIVFTVGWTKADGELLYCNPGDLSWPEGAMHIDLERRLIYGDDTSSTIHPLVTGDFAGFEGEFPLLLFPDSADPSEYQEEIAVGDLLFRISPVEGSFGDLWLIVAKPRVAGGDQESRHRSTVLYSIQDGTLSIGLSVSIGEKIYPVNYVPCGNKTLRYDDLRRFTDGNG